MSWRAGRNVVVDAVLSLLLAFLCGSGFLLEYVLIPGRHTPAVYGRRVELTFLGLDRHQWGWIHMWAGIVFAALVLVHVAFHLRAVWAMSASIVKGERTRKILLVFLSISLLVLTFFPFFVKPHVEEPTLEEGALGGRTTLGECAVFVGVSLQRLRERLGLEDASASMELKDAARRLDMSTGRLRRFLERWAEAQRDATGDATAPPSAWRR